MRTRRAVFRVSYITRVGLLLPISLDSCLYYEDVINSKLSYGILMRPNQLSMSAYDYVKKNLYLVEQGVVFYLKPPATSRSPKSEWHDGQRRLVTGKVYCAECVQYLRLKWELCGLAACTSSPICNCTLIGQRD